MRLLKRIVQYVRSSTLCDFDSLAATVVLFLIFYCFQSSEDTSKSKDGWEYAKAFTTRFHNTKRSFDMVRRKRWHRKLVREDPNAPEPVFSLTVGKVSSLITFLWLHCDLSEYEVKSYLTK